MRERSSSTLFYPPSWNTQIEPDKGFTGGVYRRLLLRTRDWIGSKWWLRHLAMNTSGRKAFLNIQGSLTYLIRARLWLAQRAVCKNSPFQSSPSQSNHSTTP